MANTNNWWDEKEPHESVFSLIKYLDSNQNGRDVQYADFMRMYSNQASLGVGADLYLAPDVSPKGNSRVSYNVVRSVIDTLTNKISKQHPKPTFLTEGGDWSLQQQAKRLEKFVTGLFHTTKVYYKGRAVFRDGGTFGDGFLKIYREGKRIHAERVFPGEIRVDDREALYGEPRQLMQYKWVDVDVLKAAYKKSAEKIEVAGAQRRPDAKRMSKARQVLVVEAWRLPSGEGAEDGRHVICIDNVTLLDEKWKRDYFPFVHFRWTSRILGFFGQGAAEQLKGIQDEIAFLLKRINKAIKLSAFQVWSKPGAVAKGQLSNEIGAHYESTEPPSFVTPQTVHPEVFAYLETLYRRAFEDQGVSQLAAQSQKPAGLDSGKALREFSDIESERFVTLGQDYEQFYIDAAMMMIDCAADIDEEFGDFAVSAPSKRFIEKIKWKEVNIAKDQYIMRVFPTSMLPDTPSGKLQTVSEMVADGFIDKDRALDLLDFPDLEGFTTLANAAVNDIKWQIEQILDKGNYSSPEPYQNLQLGVSMMTSQYLRSKNEGVPEERLEMMRQWIDEAAAMLKPPAPTVTPVAPPMVAPALPGALDPMMAAQIGGTGFPGGGGSAGAPQGGGAGGGVPPVAA